MKFSTSTSHWASSRRISAWPSRLRDVDRDRALVAVGAEIVGALRGRLPVLALDVGRAPVAGVVAGAGALDLDHVGAEVAQELRAGRPRQDAGQVEHADAGQRLRRRHARSLRLGLGHPLAGQCRAPCLTVRPEVPASPTFRALTSGSAGADLRSNQDHIGPVFHRHRTDGDQAQQACRLRHRHRARIWRAIPSGSRRRPRWRRRRPCRCR